MRLKAWLSILFMLLPAASAAQDQPDFSGHWTLVASSVVGPEVARSLTVRQPVVRTNVYGAPMPPFFKELSVERQFVAELRTETYQIGVETGWVRGIVPANREAAPAEIASQGRSSVRWEGNHLVIETRSYSGPGREAGPYTEHVEVWQLDDSGRLILSITDRGSGIEATTSTVTYRKE